MLVVSSACAVSAAVVAFKSSAVWVAVDTGLFASVVLSTLPRPTIVLVIPATVPVNVGLSRGAFKFRRVCVASETGLLTSDVLSTLPRPTIVLVIPATVPVKVGLLIGALVPRAVVIVAA